MEHGINNLATDSDRLQSFLPALNHTDA